MPPSELSKSQLCSCGKNEAWREGQISALKGVPACLSQADDVDHAGVIGILHELDRLRVTEGGNDKEVVGWRCEGVKEEGKEGVKQVIWECS